MVYRRLFGEQTPEEREEADRRAGYGEDHLDNAINVARDHLWNFIPIDFVDNRLVDYGLMSEEGDWLGIVGRGDGEERTEIPPTKLEFVGNQPSCFYAEEGGVPYRGQAKAKERIDTHIQSMSDEGRVKFLLGGPAGSGKTVLAWIIEDRIRKERIKRGLPEGNFYELLPTQITCKEELDDFMLQLKPYDTVFIDEAHIIKQAVGAEPFYHTLADTGKPRYPLGRGEGWLDVPTTISWILATTEPGELDDTTGGALRRRAQPEIFLEPPTLEELAQIIHDQDVATEEDVALEMARRSGGLPWQALLVYGEAANYAKLDNKEVINETHAKKAFNAIGIDELGLMPEDRKVIEVLINNPSTLADGKTVRWRMGEANLCAATGIDKATYKTKVQPKLMLLNLLTISQGQALTQKAVKRYDHLIYEDETENGTNSEGVG